MFWYCINALLFWVVVAVAAYLLAVVYQSWGEETDGGFIVAAGICAAAWPVALAVLAMYALARTVSRLTRRDI